MQVLSPMLKKFLQSKPGRKAVNDAMDKQRKSSATDHVEIEMRVNFDACKGLLTATPAQK